MNLPSPDSITPSQLDRIVAIERLTLVRQDNGQMVEAWAVSDPAVPAKVVQIHGDKVFGAQQNEVQFDYQITIRWRDRISATDTRLIYLGQSLEIIRQPAEIGRRRWLEMLCRVRPKQ